MSVYNQCVSFHVCEKSKKKKSMRILFFFQKQNDTHFFLRHPKKKKAHFALETNYNFSGRVPTGDRFSRNFFMHKKYL